MWKTASFAAVVFVVCELFNWQGVVALSLVNGH